MSSSHEIKNKKNITIVAPFYNEEDVVAEFCEAVREVINEHSDYDFKIICVNDGSSDQTLLRLNEQSKNDGRFAVICLSRNFGHQTALYAGISLSPPETDAVITMDSDLQHPPRLIPALVEKWEQGHDIVSTIRQKTEGIGPFKKLTSKLFYRFISAVSDTHIPEGCGDYCLYDKKVCNVILQFEERSILLRGIASWVGFSRAFVCFNAPPRKTGKSKYSLRKMLKLASDGYFSFSVNPLRFCLKLGMIFCAASFFYLTYAIIIYAQDGTVRGWTSLLAVIVLFGGMNLFTIGLVGEYIGRTFEETKKRPRFVVSYKSF